MARDMSVLHFPLLSFCFLAQSFNPDSGLYTLQACDAFLRQLTWADSNFSCFGFWPSAGGFGAWPARHPRVSSELDFVSSRGFFDMSLGDIGGFRALLVTGALTFA